MKVPQLLAGAHIVSARIARHAARHFVLLMQMLFAGTEHVHADQNHVLINRRHARERNVHGQLAFIAEAGIELAGLGVQRHHLVTGGEENARGIFLVARPVSDAALRRRAGLQFVAPDLGAGIRIERHDTISRRQIHHAVDHDGRHFVHRSRRRAVRVGPQPVGPGLRELRRHCRR